MNPGEIYLDALRTQVRERRKLVLVRRKRRRSRMLVAIEDFLEASNFTRELFAKKYEVVCRHVYD